MFVTVKTASTGSPCGTDVADSAQRHSRATFCHVVRAMDVRGHSAS